MNRRNTNCAAKTGIKKEKSFSKLSVEWNYIMNTSRLDEKPLHCNRFILNNIIYGRLSMENNNRYNFVVFGWRRADYTCSGAWCVYFYCSHSFSNGKKKTGVVEKKKTRTWLTVQINRSSNTLMIQTD